MSDLDPLRNLAQTLAPDLTVPVTMTKATVQAYSIGGQPPTLSIYLSGDNTTLIQGVRFIDSYSPAIGDVVQVIKQGPMLLVLGQIAGGANHAANGWVTPLLSSGFAEHIFDPPMYRLILDNGSKKIQLRGRLNITGTPSLMWTMPTDLRPALSLGPILIARDPNGAVAAQLDVQASGAMNLINTSVGVASVGSTVSSVDPADGTTTTNTDHKHKARDFGGAGDPVYADQWTEVVVWSFQGTQGVAHSHGVTGSHFHNVTVNAPGFPTFVSLNGVEYFI